MKSYADLFGGFGGVTLGAIAAGLQPEWSIELDPAIAEVATTNFAHRIHVANILACDPRKFDKVDVLHASPPCPNFSLAKVGAAETPLDLALACKVAEFVTVLRPRVFTLENVFAYRLSRSWHVIEAALQDAGYWLHVAHINCADVGVPQTRKRMIVRAVLGGFVPYLPESVPWVGWLAAVADLLDTLPESQFAPWQLARLPNLLASTLVGVGGYRDGITIAEYPNPSMTVTSNENMLTVRAFLMVGGGNTNFAEAHAGKGCRYEDEPSHTIAAISREGGAMPKAWLVGGDNTSNGLTMRDDNEPALTVTTGGPKHPTRALFGTGRVVSMTQRALARFQSFPDTYILPDNARSAARGIGNAVPPLLMEKIFKGLEPCM